MWGFRSAGYDLWPTAELAVTPTRVVSPGFKHNGSGFSPHKLNQMWLSLQSPVPWALQASRYRTERSKPSHLAGISLCSVAKHHTRRDFFFFNLKNSIL